MGIRVVHSPSASSVANAAATGGQEELRRYFQQMGLQQQKLNLSRYDILQRGALAREQMAQQNASQARTMAFQHVRDVEQSQNQWRRDQFLAGLETQRQAIAQNNRMEMAGFEWGKRQDLTNLGIDARQALSDQEITARQGMNDQAMAGRMDMAAMGDRAAMARLQSTYDFKKQQQQQEFDQRVQQMLGNAKGALAGAMENPELWAKEINDVNHHVQMGREAKMRYDNAPTEQNRKRYEEDMAAIEGYLAPIVSQLPEAVPPLKRVMGQTTSAIKFMEEMGIPPEQAQDLIQVTKRGDHYGIEKVFDAPKSKIPDRVALFKAVSGAKADYEKAKQAFSLTLGNSPEDKAALAAYTFDNYLKSVNASVGTIMPHDPPSSIDGNPPPAGGAAPAAQGVGGDTQGGGGADFSSAVKEEDMPLLMPAQIQSMMEDVPKFQASQNGLHTRSLTKAGLAQEANAAVRKEATQWAKSQVAELTVNFRNLHHRGPNHQELSEIRSRVRIDAYNRSKAVLKKILTDMVKQGKSSFVVPPLLTTGSFL